MGDQKPKQELRKFNDQIDWQKISVETYQNAQYEGLRPISHRYLPECHLRVKRYLKSAEKYLLDAGSNPFQYPEYLPYSKKYQYRVCLDISIIALKEVRERVRSNHCLFVVADLANLPFKDETFDEIVSLYTLLHLTISDYVPAYENLKHVLKENRTDVIVNGWSESMLMRWLNKPIHIMKKSFPTLPPFSKQVKKDTGDISNKPKGMSVDKYNVHGLLGLLGTNFPISMNLCRSVSVRFLRAMILQFLFDRIWLSILFRFEELFPTFFNEKGHYPLITITK